MTRGFLSFILSYCGHWSTFFSFFQSDSSASGFQYEGKEYKQILEMQRNVLFFWCLLFLQVLILRNKENFTLNIFPILSKTQTQNTRQEELKSRSGFYFYYY